ncbi:hypothetical protein E8E11_005344 [Didymella keratinophila]|nr:hypothetical protein E8E11_005344 [Didymella keratinophila]
MTIAAIFGILMCFGLLTFTSAAFGSVLPGVPKLKGYPILGAIPIYFRDGMALMLETLTTLGDEGIAYAQVGNKTLVLGDPRVFSWSPFWTLIRLLDHNLFDDVGHEAMRQRGVFIKEFNNPLSNVGKLDGVMRVAAEHVRALAENSNSTEISDIRHAADNFAATLWGDTLYGRSDALTDGRVMKVADEILRRAGSPWPSALYSFMLTLGLVEPGKPTPSESKVRTEIENLYEKNVQHLEDYERNNPDSPMKTIRRLSVADGGKRTGPLTRFATQFARLNVFGGHQSIDSNITWTLIELQKRPDVLTRSLAEIEAVAEVSFTSVTTKMPYLDAIIMETNRLYPSVPATLRVIERETRLVTAKKPVILKPGMLIYLSYLHMHISPKYWGPTAGVFDPDRFLGGIDKSWVQIRTASGQGVPHYIKQLRKCRISHNIQYNLDGHFAQLFHDALASRNYFIGTKAQRYPFFSRLATAMALAPLLLHNCIAAAPTPLPAPVMITASPALTPAQWHMFSKVENAHGILPSSTSLQRGAFTAYTSVLGALVYCANAPSHSEPKVQHSNVPEVYAVSNVRTITRSPIRDGEIEALTATMRPQQSPPWMRGKDRGTPDQDASLSVLASEALVDSEEVPVLTPLL